VTTETAKHVHQITTASIKTLVILQVGCPSCHPINRVKGY